MERLSSHEYITTVSLGPKSAGMITLCLGIGFLMIFPLSLIFSAHLQRWSLIRGGILEVVGTLLLLGGIGLDILTWVGRLWPLVLVAFGGYFLWEVYRRQSH